MWRNLVIEGGGARIAAIGGTLRALEQKGILKNITKYGGTSSGAITAAGLAIGYTGTEIADILVKTNFTAFKDDDYGFARDAYRFVKKWGIYRGDVFHKWVRDLVSVKTNSDNYTFRNLYDDTKKDLVIVSTNVNEGRPYYLSRYTYPDMEIAQAVRMSMSVPFGFVPVRFNKCYYVDGGVSDNYPLHMFDGHYPLQMRTIFKSANPETLGLKLMDKDEQRDERIFHANNDINNIIAFSSALVTHMQNRIERLNVSPDYWSRTISVPTSTIGTMEFDLTRDRKIEIQNQAFKSTISQLKKMQPGIVAKL